MSTKKAQRRSVARGLKYTGLPLPIRVRLAKVIVAGNAHETCGVLSAVGCTVVHHWGCECCDPYSNQEWDYKGKRFFTEYGQLDRALTEKRYPRVKGPGQTPGPIDVYHQARMSDLRISLKKARDEARTVEERVTNHG